MRTATCALVALMMLLGSGCKMTPAQRLNTAVTAELQLKQLAADTWSDSCSKKADKCVADGVTVSTQCQPWVKCQDNLKRFYMVHVVFMKSANRAAWFLLNNDASTANKVIITAMDAFKTAHELARAEGVIK